MCGIVGIFGDLTFELKEAFEDLLVINSIRGNDSTGVATLTYQKDLLVVKDVGDPYVLLWDEKYKKLRNRGNLFLLGHGRAATKGKINHENAHPFRAGRIVGVHNGTLHGRDFKIGNQKFNTDSEWLINKIYRNGIEDVWENLSGAATLVWFDGEEETINFIRNDERPFSYGITEDEKTIIFASEFWMVQGICKKYGIKLKGSVLTPNPHNLFTVSQNIGKPLTIEWRELEHKSSVGFYKNRYYTPWEEDENYIREWPRTTKVETRIKNGVHIITPKKEDSKVVHIREMIDSLNDDMKEMEEVSKNQLNLPLDAKKRILESQETSSLEEFINHYRCCTWCGVSLEDQYDITRILNRYDALCSECAQCADDGAKEFVCLLTELKG